MTKLFFGRLPKAILNSVLAHQIADCSRVVGRICLDGIIRPAGWKMLPSVRKVTDILTDQSTSVDSIEFIMVYFIHPLSTYLTGATPTFSIALQNKVNGESKPSIAVINGCHAVTFFKEESNQYVFKNSYGKNDPQNPEEIKIPVSNTPSANVGVDYMFDCTYGFSLQAQLFDRTVIET